MSESPRIYWAHSAQSKFQTANSSAGWQRLADHLAGVAALAATLASKARPSDDRFSMLARLAGALHDLGKYSDRFQRMLVTGEPAGQHAIYGALLAFFGHKSFSFRPGLEHIAASIAAHHAGLPDRSSLKQRLTDGRFHAELHSLLERAQSDSPLIGDFLRSAFDGLRLEPASPEASSLDLYTRMLFSTLVDADRLDSAGRGALSIPLNPSARLQQLLAHLSKLNQRAPEGAVKSMRAQVLADCLSAADSPSHLFSLSVPTGGGKTLAAMAFALRRAELHPHRYRRVIVVIPYLSIIEQNAQVYADIFGNDAVLEHHSGSHRPLTVAPPAAANSDADALHYVPARAPEAEADLYQQPGLRLETENWDAPLIVTTSVRFFESLFSNHPRDLRRVHNIARSIVILDEVQTLPRRLIAPLLDIMGELSRDWDVDFVFSTATLPAFERPHGKQDPRWPPGTLTEIVREPEPLRKVLKRAELRWGIEVPVPWSQVAERALQSAQSLVIVNLRNHAAELHAELKRQFQALGRDEQALFHLSTRMAAAHRLRQISKIHERLRTGLPCQVVSTQLIEAGVDLDFPLVLRALAPLDSIIQAAGRADREGSRSQTLGRPAGQVVIFQPLDGKTPPHEYAEATALTKTLATLAAEAGASIQVDSAEAISNYFERYYGTNETALGKELVDLRSERAFDTLAAKFELISSRTRDVFVPDDPEAVAAIAQLRAIGQLTASLRRTLQRHTVGLNPSEFQRARILLEELSPGSEIYIAMEQAYDARLGLLFELEAASCYI